MEPAPAAGADLTRLPKVELHVHLEGAIAPDLAERLARRHGREPTRALILEDGGYPRRYRDFPHFLRTFLAVSDQLCTPDDLAETAAAFAREQTRQRVRWTEVTFTAATHVDAGMEPAAMWAALRDGLAAAGPDTGIGLVVDVVRDAGPEAAERTLRLVEAADAPIVGLGLSGLEGSVPESAFTSLRRAADQLGLGLTVHAGETGGPDNVRAAIETLGADRIGHGLAVVDEPALLRRVAADGIPLEVCPSSNAALGLVPDVTAHPLPRMRTAGATVTVGSDDPALFATSLTDELAHVHALLGGPRDVLAQLQLDAARAAFAPARRRERLIEEIEAWRVAA